MGNFLHKEPPPPMVLVPPLFDYPPLEARNRMLESGYDVLFGKLALHCLFEDYFQPVRHFSTKIMLKPIDDPLVDLVANVSGPLDNNEGESITGDASFRRQSDLGDPHSFMDLRVSNTHEILRLRSCAYYPKYGVGVFGIFPLIAERRIHSEDYGVVGLTYGSGNLSIGTTLFPCPLAFEFPRSAWAVGRLGRLTAGVQYKPDFGIEDSARFNNLMNWSWTVGYGLGSSSPLCPSFHFGLELAKSSQLIASFYQHLVVQRRVKNPVEESEIVGITNYIDFGFELEKRIEGDESSNSLEKSAFQVAASWQANKNFLVKGKVGQFSSSIALAFKSWWKPSFTFSISAVRDHKVGNTSFGFGFQIENLREASYQRADPNHVMLTPTKEHLAEGIMQNTGKRPMLQSDITSGNFENIPRDLEPIDKLF